MALDNRVRSSGAGVENAQQIGVHESPETAELCDRTVGLVTLDEIERIVS